MKVTIRIGSTYHLKGSREVIKEMQELVSKNGLDGEMGLSGSFYSGNCVSGVCITIDGQLFSLKPEDTKKFSAKEIRRRL